MEQSSDLVWRALSEPTRRRIVHLLRDGPRTTGELAEAFPTLSRFAVMKHLDVLEEANLVLPRREGRTRLNYLNAVPLRGIYERWVGNYASNLAGSALALKRTVESGSMSEKAKKSDATELPPALENARVLKVEQELSIAAPIERVWACLIDECPAWWPHKYRDHGRTIVEPFFGGRFYEDWGNGAGAVHAMVTYFDPPRAICFRGSFGMQGAGMVVKWNRLEADPKRAGATLFKTSLHAAGEIPDEVASGYTSGTGAVMTALKRYVEEGKRFESNSKG